jgi:hypothetical protein
MRTPDDWVAELDAFRRIRIFAKYLDEHPQAIRQGRRGQKIIQLSREVADVVRGIKAPEPVTRDERKVN